MQAIKQTVSPAELAGSLALLWQMVNSSGDGSSFFALIDELGLSLTQMKCLMILEHCESPVTVGDLAERVGLSLASASRTVEGLHRRDWTERREDEHDRRVKRVSLTTAGHDVAQRIARARVQGLEGFAASLSGEQRLSLHSVITDLAHATSKD